MARRPTHRVRRRVGWLRAALETGCAIAAAVLLAGAVQEEPPTPSPATAPPSDAVKVCQVGYLPGEAKFAMLTSEPTGPILVRRGWGGTVALRVPAGEPVKDGDSGDTVWPVDFSQLREPGTYHLEITGIGHSHPFTIGRDVFATPFRHAIRAFTGQRCGTSVSLAPDFPQYAYPACHTDLAQYHASSGAKGLVECTGGWHDAGDYNRYTVNSGITTGTLLLAYELNADQLRDLKLDLPESNNDVPDFLDEVRWNLDWMLKMQDADGGVWHKTSSANFCGFVMPQEDTDPMLIIGSGNEPYKITTGTGDLAAVAAIASRVYREFDPEYADKCLEAARKAFDWCIEHPEALYQRNPEGINTGGYGDGDASDEILWAAAELFRTTGEEKYGRYFLNHYDKFKLSADSAQGWPSVGNLALYAYAFTDQPNVDKAVKAKLREQAIAAADGIVQRMSTNGYRNPLTPRDYVWGSNGVVGNYGIMLRLANHIEPKPAYVNAAQDCLHYLFGRNTFNTSFVSQVGSKSVMNLHHRPSAADGIEQPWPGLLSGGPNAYTNDLPNPDGPPATQWVDDEDRYDLNENAINWNAPLVFLLAEALPEQEAHSALLPATRPAAVALTAGPTFPMIEASFTLDVEGNPFDFTENNVMATLVTPDGEIELPAFYDGDDTWRVRHSPTTKGTHRIKRVTLNDERIDVGDLTLEASAPTTSADKPDHGFLRLDDSKQHFVFDDGTPYYPVGYNLAWRHMGDPPMPKLTVSLERMGDARVNWTRLWMNHWDSKNLDWIEQRDLYDQPPIGELNLEIARKWDEILAAAEANGVYMQIALQHHGQYSSEVNPNWEINPWNADNGGFLETPDEFFTNERARDLTKQKYRYLIARYGYSPAVMAWELFNEVQFTDAFRNDDVESVAAWHEEMGQFIKAHDPYAHLVTTSSVVEEPSLWTAMDYYQAHVYPPDLLAAIESLDARELDRAYFYGEIGGNAGGDDPNAAAESVHELLWGSLMSQSAGAAQYWYWTIVEPRGILPQYTAVQKFLDLAGIRGRTDLEPIDVLADTGGRGLLSFGPGIDWAPSLTTDYVVKQTGKVEGLGGMSAYLQGDSNREMFPHAEFSVDFPEDGTFAVRFNQLSTDGANVELAVDGEVRSSVTLDPPSADDEEQARPSPLRLAISTPISAGEHTIRLTNTGADWIRIGEITLTPYAPELAVKAKGNDELVVLWAYRRDDTTIPKGESESLATLAVPDMPAGSYAVQWIDTMSGEVVGLLEVAISEDGPLTLNPPPITTDIAAVIRAKTASSRAD